MWRLVYAIDKKKFSEMHACEALYDVCMLGSHLKIHVNYLFNVICVVALTFHLKKKIQI